MNKQYKYIIKNAIVIDGTGSPSYPSDVAIEDDKIAKIDKQINAELAETIIDARGNILAPGFIDVHTHDDLNVIKSPDMLAKISQGVTSVIVGNCGISAAATKINQGLPDPLVLLGKENEFIYEDVTSYQKAVNNAKPSVNVATLIGHTSLRNNVLQDLSKPASSEQAEKMASHLKACLSQGAIGLSSGLAYKNAFHSSEQEVHRLAKELADFNAIYTSHIRDEFDGILDAMQEAFKTGMTNRSPVVISHHKCAGKQNWGRTKETLDLINETLKKQDIGLDCYPYTASSSTLDLKQVTEDFDIDITWSEPHPEMAGNTIKEIAKKWQLSLMDAAKKLMPAGAIYHNMHAQDLENILKHPLTMIGSDGLPNDPNPHPRLWGSFTRVLGHYSNELKFFSLEKAIYKMTGLSASRFNIKDRGFIKPGYFADLVLFNKSDISDRATFSQPIQKSNGILKVFVNGCETYDENQNVIARNGRFLRHQAI